MWECNVIRIMIHDDTHRQFLQTTNINAFLMLHLFTIHSTLVDVLDGVIQSPSRCNRFFFPHIPIDAEALPNQHPLQWVPWALSPGVK